MPEDGYGGQYIADIADAVTAQRPDAPGLPDAEAQEVYRDVGVQMMFDEIKRDLHDFGVDFDVYFHEDDLHASGAVERAVARLTEMGNTYEKDGALWLRTEQYGDDKDRVLIKSTASRRTSPGTSPTTSTRGSAGSTAASSCSARTTTGTSAG